MGGFEVNSYVIHAPEGALIVDAGTEPEKLLAATRQPVAAILLTHGHHDHVGALQDVRRKTGAPVYAHPADAEGAGIAGNEPLRNGEDIVMAGVTINVVHTPGHSPGSVAFVLGQDQIVGDLILPGSVGGTDISGASWDKIEVSVRKVMPLWEGATHVVA